jgi:acyl-CoA thioesterase I
MNKSSRRKFIKTVAINGMLVSFGASVFAANSNSLNEKTHKKNSIERDEKDNYLELIKAELVKEWPKNRTINLVFHGHSVPSGYFKTPEVNTFNSYPFLLLKELRSIYRSSVVNIILTSKGGENSMQGAKRFKKEVLIHKPDVLFIDYALNDIGISAVASRKAWEYMIKGALKRNIKVILLTATPDQRVDLLSKETDLQKICNQVIELSKKYQIGLVDNYSGFQKLVSSGEKLTDYMSQVNHPNEKGHQLIANQIVRYF